LLSLGCANLPTSTPPTSRTHDDSAELVVRQRARELWGARVERDWATVYGFEDPAKRKQMSQAAFVEWSQQNQLLQINTFQLGRAFVEGDLAWVEVDFNASLSRFPETPARDASQNQKWRRLGGAWYPVPTDELDAYPESPALRDAEEEKRLRARFEESWDLRREGDCQGLYLMIDPRDRVGIAADDFVKSESRIAYTACRLHWIEVIGDRGRVHVSIEHKVTDPSLTKLPSQTQRLTERWTLYEGDWYRDLRR
jgi:hypothetical protein